MTANDTKIWFVRHGESYKNLKGIHGGSGQCLTVKGIQECHNIVSKIQSTNIDVTKLIIVGHNSQQVIESMNICASNLNCHSIIDERIKGIHLGVANGISREELKVLFPNDASMLDEWRARKISINDLKVTNMEGVNDFYKRIIEFIHSCQNNEKVKTFIVVGTTSILIMIINLVVLGIEFDYNSYYHYNVINGDYIIVNLKNDLTLELVETSVHLE